MNTTPKFTKPAVKSWMRANRANHEDPTTGEINATSLAEEAADHFGVKDLGGPLDDSDHWIWDLAAEVAGP